MRGTLVLVAVVGLLASASIGAVAVLAAAPGPDYLDVQTFSVSSLNGNVARLSVTGDAAIPRRPDAFIGARPVVGFGWADLQTGKAFVTTIHPVIGRDSHQNPDAWHAHTVSLGGGASAPNDFCLVSIDSTPTAGIQIHGSTMTVNVRRSVLPVTPAAYDAAVGFSVEADAACASGLAVLVRDGA
jgi:hypothetical protein